MSWDRSVFSERLQCSTHGKHSDQKSGTYLCWRSSLNNGSRLGVERPWHGPDGRLLELLHSRAHELSPERVTVAVLVARLIVASCTPGTASNAASPFDTHPPHWSNGGRYCRHGVREARSYVCEATRITEKTVGEQKIPLDYPQNNVMRQPTQEITSSNAYP